MEDLIKWKRCFEIFLIDHCASDIANSNIAGKYQNILVSLSSTYTRRASSHRLLHLYFLGQCNICMVYLYVKEACLKVIFAVFYFCHSNYSSNIVKNIFNSISIYFWKKISLLTNITNKCYKENNVSLQKLIKFGLQGKHSFWHLQNERSFRKNFSFPFSVKYFDRNFLCLF